MENCIMLSENELIEMIKQIKKRARYHGGATQSMWRVKVNEFDKQNELLHVDVYGDRFWG